MDLRSVLNTSDNGERAPPKAPPTPQQQQQHQGRPSQGGPGPQYAYREYPQQAQSHPSPGKPMSAEYPRHAQQQPPSAAYPPSPYQNSGGQYPPRPSPHMPPHSAGPFHDVRSPGGVPAQSPYRQTPTHANSVSGYPFPPQEMASPSQRHQYPPSHYPPPHPQQQQQQHPQHPQHPQQQQQQQQQPPHGHDPYPPGGPGPSPGPYPHQQQQQQQQQHHHHQVPQTPPIGGPGGQFVHQRSQSAQSTPTPTSAQSQQHHFGPPHAHGSPVPPSRSNTEYRQPSQPPTPLGPPQSAGARQPSQPASFAQPPSPYQHRVSSLGHLQQPQSPALNPPSRRVSGTSLHESPAPEGLKRRKSSHEREHSLSVSPRTRVASVASNAERALTSPVDADKKMTTLQHQSMDVDKIVTPAKRKLDDRNLSPQELEHKESRPPPGASNGLHVNTDLDSKPITAPKKKKRTRHPEPPIWAQSAHSLGNKMPAHANFVLQKRTHAHLNGKADGGASKAERPSRQGSPETSRASQSAPTTKPTSAVAEPGPQDILGPWEASITGVKPYEEMSKTVADFIFIHVVNNPDIKEILSRGIQFEIEAKLGTLIDKDTNYRVDRFLDSECILHDTGRVAFRSSMTEAHHKAFNDFLNHVVIQTDPRAPNGGGRVQVHYKHRREVDKYFELTPELQNRLPGCVRSRLGSRARNVKARVTYDQKTGQVLNKIIKARVADIDIHMPMNPMDCRLSINLEMDWDGPVEELEQLGPSPSDKMPDRQKDRLSYTQGHYQVDLTQVTLASAGPGNTQKMEKEHELEIELASPIVLDQGNKAMSGAPHRYQELIEGLLDNVRVLARKAREFS